MENLSVFLQIALTLASISVIVLVVCLVPVLLQLNRQMEKIAGMLDDLKGNINTLISDCRELVGSVKELSERLTQQVDNAGDVVNTVQQWTENTNRMINGIETAIETPFFGILRKAKLLQMGAATFIQALFHPKRTNQNQEENDHGK